MRGKVARRRLYLVVICTGLAAFLCNSQQARYYYTWNNDLSILEKMNPGPPDFLLREFEKQQKDLTFNELDNPKGSRVGKENLVLELLGGASKGFFCRLGVQ